MIIALCAVIALIINLGGILIYDAIRNAGSDDPLPIVQGNNPAINPWLQIVEQVYGASVSFLCEDSQYRWAGSGIVISPDGYILTNDHVAGDQGIRRMECTLSNGDVYNGTFVASDPNNDVALIKIDGDGLTYVRIGNSDTVQVGEACIAIGNSLGELPDTVSQGIVSHINREIHVGGRPSTQRLFQITASASSGNSGGGVLNSRGELIALFSAKTHSYADQTGYVEDADSLNYAVPINYAIAVIERSGADINIPSTPTLGINGIEVDVKSAKNSSYYPSAGVYIESVVDFGPAYFMGLYAYDKVLSVNNKAINSASDIDSSVSSTEIGDTVKVEIERNGVVYVYQIPVMRKY